MAGLPRQLEWRRFEAVLRRLGYVLHKSSRDRRERFTRRTGNQGWRPFTNHTARRRCRRDDEAVGRTSRRRSRRERGGGRGTTVPLEPGHRQECLCYRDRFRFSYRFKISRGATSSCQRGRDLFQKRRSVCMAQVCRSTRRYRPSCVRPEAAGSIAHCGPWERRKPVESCNDVDFGSRSAAGAFCPAAGTRC